MSAEAMGSAATDGPVQPSVIDGGPEEAVSGLSLADFTLRLAIRRAGHLSELHLFPDPADPDLVARVTVGRATAPTPEVSVLAAAIVDRHTNRWPFARAVVPADVLAQLTTAARLEGATLTVANAVNRTTILGLSQAADRRQRAHAATAPSWAGGPCRRPAAATASRPRSSAVLATPGDTERHWLQAGQALQCVLLKATSLGLATTPISQPIEIPAIRELLTDTRAAGWAQMIIRIGYGRPASATPRRPIDEVLLS